MVDSKLSFIGAGNMANAIYEGVSSNTLYTPSDICVSNVHQEKLDKYLQRGSIVTTDNKRAAKFGDIIVLSIKPQLYDAVLDEIGSLVSGKCIVIIAPGFSTEYILSKCKGAYVVRAMPNTPLLVGMGMTAIAENNNIPSEVFNSVISIFSCAGKVCVIPEDRMNEIISVSGSSPAYFFRFAEAIVKAAAEMGIDKNIALTMAAATMAGSAEMLIKSGKTATELINQVSSKGGTTVAALSAFDEMDFDGMVKEAMSRCTERAYELGH